ncbi:MAG: ABC transporter substrate-binding protein [Bacillota bacterium]
MKKLMRNKGILLAAILVLAAGLLAAGCGGEETSGSGGEPYRIGAVVDISGNSSSLGIPERDTLLMLVEELNANGGIEGTPVELTILDNKSG